MYFNGFMMVFYKNPFVIIFDFMTDISKYITEKGATDTKENGTKVDLSPNACVQ